MNSVMGLLIPGSSLVLRMGYFLSLSKPLFISVAQFLPVKKEISIFLICLPQRHEVTKFRNQM